MDGLKLLSYCVNICYWEMVLNDKYKMGYVSCLWK